MRKRQYLTPAQKYKRFERRTEGWHGTERDRFSDEKLFTIEATVNNQNDKVYAKSLAGIDDSVKTVFRRQKS